MMNTDLEPRFISEWYGKLSDEYGGEQRLWHRIIDTTLQGVRDREGDPKGIYQTALLYPTWETTMIIIEKRGGMVGFKLGPSERFGDMQKLKLIMIHRGMELEALRRMIGLDRHDISGDWHELIEEAIRKAKAEKYQNFPVTQFLAALPSVTLTYGGEACIPLFGMFPGAAVEHYERLSSTSPISMFNKDNYLMFLVPNE